MRVVVFGATGNVGTSVVRALAAEPAVASVLGVARRLPGLDLPGVDWAPADVAVDDLRPLVDGADAVVHLAWRIQPARELNELWRTNVVGTGRVLEAAAGAGVQAVVAASSVGAYSPGPKDRAVDESWPTNGVPTSFYARHKAEQERALAACAERRPHMRVVALRPGLIFKREAASGIARLFLGPLLASGPGRAPLRHVVPDVPGLRFQAVHADDVAEAFRLALLGDARGAYNVAAEPVLDPPVLARLAGARLVPVPAAALRGAASLAWRLRLQPSPPGWIDLALGVPIMDCGRARHELGWEPRVSATDALQELAEGIAARAGAPTPPLESRAERPVQQEPAR
ncbi:MAG: NAD-dependent epimerase/dehydratase family protein [Thermoleophilia bacterium]